MPSHVLHSAHLIPQPFVECKPHIYSLTFSADVPIRAAFTDRAYDAGHGTDRRGINAVCKELGINEAAAKTLKQVHGNTVFIVDSETPWRDGEGDGLATVTAGIPLCIRTADCVPVFIYARQHPFSALIHAGWRGIVAGILPAAMQQAVQCGIPPQLLSVAFGPAIRTCCYTVRDDVAQHFQPWCRQIAEGQWSCDLVGRIADELHHLGIPRTEFHDCGICTACRNEFFSYRREGAATGRMLSLMMLRA